MSLNLKTGRSRISHGVLLIATASIAALRRLAVLNGIRMVHGLVVGCRLIFVSFRYVGSILVRIADRLNLTLRTKYRSG
jgi:hypothetical protein